MKKQNYFLNVKEFMKLCLLSAGLIFSGSVISQDLNSGLKLHYSFESASGATVADVSGNGYDGTLFGATVGVSNGKNSLILSTSGTDYLDMGANTGALVASLSDFSMSSYVWVNTTNTVLSNNGNMIATFSNSLDSYNTNNGYMYLQAKRSRYAITSVRYETEQAAETGADVAKGKWVHMAYTQTGTIGKLYIDGVLKSTNPAVDLIPSSLGATAYNMLAKPSYNGDKFLSDSQISDFRVYNRAISSDEVLMLNGYSSELISAYNSLTLGDISALTADITLPATSGTMPIVWTSSLPLVITTDGKVTRPDQYDATVKLTATLTQTVDGVPYTLSKVFAATVVATQIADDLLANWDFDAALISEDNGTFKVTSASTSAFVGTVMNDARIRTIGTTTKFNVLDLGNGTGYFDMGTEIGKAIYSLNDYSMCGYFRIDADYASLNNDGNFIWSFSNSADIDVDKNGYIIGSLKSQSQSIATNYYNVGNQAVGANTNAAVGGWHHIAYTQSGTTGTIYVDGVSVATGQIANLPSTAITIEGRTGTLYNWLGRSTYKNDSYLKKTLLYGFQLLKTPLSANDISFGYGDFPGVADMIGQLNVAYDENPDYILPELATEMDNLTLPDLSAVTANIALPVKGTDATVSISWKSTNDQLIDANGVVTRPNYYNYPDTLTATLSKSGQKVTKRFPAVVILKEGTQFANDLLVKFDFASVSDSVVTDAAEKHFAGRLKKNASIRTIGTAVKYNVLSLGDSIGYFDMGTEVGKLMYNLNDYTVGAYYRVDTAYATTALASNGNFLWNFSNSDDILKTPTGYILGSLRNHASTITPTNWTPEQTIAYGSPALKGNWHHFAYTQSGTTGTIYVDGIAQATGPVTSLPASTLTRAGQLGTLYNWIGRSCYIGDVYLRKSLVYDFRLYRTALNVDQIQSSVLNVNATISALEAASNETPNAVKSVLDSPYKVVALTGAIQITGLTGGEKVSLFDIAGRQLKVSDPTRINVNAGIYIVRINDFVSKTIVR